MRVDWPSVEDASHDTSEAAPSPHSAQQPRAFPQYGDPGMTLRDWFAGRALPGILSGCPDPCDAWTIASCAYALADAMLAARKAPVRGEP